MKEISQSQLKEMLILGGETLTSCYETINALNVFPVPDGDTGTNMNMTIQSGVKAILNLEAENVAELTKAFSKGLLLGARGNSGVILSQFFRGFAEGMQNTGAVNVKVFSKSLKEGQKRAYGSVIKAVEGTILTVIKDMANYKPQSDNFLEYFDELMVVGQKSLDNTPNLLPVLKEVGVVDSGGAGLLEIFKGMHASLTGKKVKNTLGDNFETFKQTEEHPMDINDIVFGYCTEMLIELESEIDILEVRQELETYGDSIVAVEDDGILKAHVHTEKPLDVFAYGRSLGDFVNIKSENMRIQARDNQGEKIEHEQGVVVVCSSKEMAKLFSDVQKIEPIIGGQTLNPSTEDIIKAIKNTNAKNILILPNNSNIIMAAQSAKDLIKDKNIEIVKTKYMTQGFESLINYNPETNIKENKEIIEESLKSLINYEITTAIKDTKIGDVNITKDNFLIIKDGDIVSCVKKEEEIFNFIKEDIDLEAVDILSIFVGEQGNEKMVKKFNENLENEFEFLETKLYNTKQPVYNYLISALEE